MSPVDDAFDKMVSERKKKERYDTFMAYGIGVYILVAITTFGYSYNNVVMPKDRDGDPIIRSLTGLMCGGLWPLYWSVQVFSHDKETVE